MPMRMSIFAMVLIVGACASEPAVVRPSGVTRLNETPDSCTIRDPRSYGETPIGEWLTDLLLKVGAPNAQELAAGEIGDTGTALEVSAEQYIQMMNVYANAQKPPDEDFAPADKTVIGREGDFTFYYSSQNNWKAWTAFSSEWQLSLVAFPAAGRASVNWGPSEDAILDWFSRGLEEAATHPPPHCT